MTQTTHIATVLEKMRAIRDAELPHGQKAVLFALCIRLNEDLKCWPSLSRLAKDAGMSKNTLTHRLTELRESGWVNWTVGEGRSTNIYSVFHSPKARAIQKASWSGSRTATDASGPGAGHVRSGSRTVVVREQDTKLPRSETGSGTDFEMGEQRELGYGGSSLQSILSDLDQLREETKNVSWRQVHGRSSRRSRQDELEEPERQAAHG